MNRDSKCGSRRDAEMGHHVRHVQQYYESAQAARTELVKAGYVDLHVPPGVPRLWKRPGIEGRKAIARLQTGQFTIIDYDEFEWLEAS